MRGIVAIAVALAVTTSFAACGGGEASNSNEQAGGYAVKLVTARFPSTQRLGETSLMRIGVLNTGHRTVPALNVRISIAGKAGETASLPFAIHDPEPGLAQPDRPVWVLSEHYPRLAGASISAGAETSGRKTFNFGPLKPGARTEAVWKLSAVRTGRFTVLYSVDAGLGGKARAEGAGGEPPHGSFTVRISSVPPNTIVTDSGKVVTIPGKR